MPTFQQQLIDIDACGLAVEWVDGKTITQAWRECLLPTWIAWLCDHGRGKIDGLPTDREVLEASLSVAQMVLNAANTTNVIISVPNMRTYEAMLDGCAWEYTDERLGKKAWAQRQMGETDFYDRNDTAGVRQVFRYLWAVYAERRHPPQEMPEFPVDSFERLVYHATEAIRGPVSNDSALAQISHLLRVKLPLHLG